MGIELVHGEQAAFIAAPHEHHGAAGAFAQPALSFKRGQPIGEGAPQITAGR
jgi:hypothetical protein